MDKYYIYYTPVIGKINNNHACRGNRLLEHPDGMGHSYIYISKGLQNILLAKPGMKCTLVQLYQQLVHLLVDPK